MQTNAPGASAPRPFLRITLYRALRLIAGPVAAHRVAFGFGEVRHG